MAISSINQNITPKYTMTSFMANRKEISYGYMHKEKLPDVKQNIQESSLKDKTLAAIGSVTGVGIVLAGIMKKQKIKNPFKIEYTVKEMLTMAGCANLGGILLSSIGESVSNQKKKWKEGAFQMILTSAPMLLVDTAIKKCSKSSCKWINNNLTKIAASVAGVAVGSNAAIVVSNRLRSGKDTKKPKRELRPIDMIANLDDAVAVLVLAKVPFADKIHIERALPFIYSFCGYRSGTGDKR